MSDEKPQWAFYIFSLVLIEAIAIIILSEITSEIIFIVSGAAVLLFILIVLLIIIYLLIHYYTQSSSDDFVQGQGNETSMISPFNDSFLKEQNSTLDSNVSEFQEMVQIVSNEFHPQIIKDEEELKNQLVRFLDMKFPHHEIVRQGHDTVGGHEDIVVDGTYVFDLSLVSNEGKLIYILDQVLSAKKDFCEIAVVLIDTGDVLASTFKEYVNEFETAGIKTIVKKIKR